eukprot:Skav210091  [mRNA]  locus=scaffold1510:287207:288319:- [translate_table: standard]
MGCPTVTSPVNSSAMTSISSSTPKLPAAAPPAVSGTNLAGATLGVPTAPMLTPGLAPPSNGSLSACVGQSGLGFQGGAPPARVQAAALVPPGVLAELQASRPQMPAAMASQPTPAQPSQPGMEAQIQAMAAGKLSAIEAMAGIEAPAQSVLPEIPKLPKLDNLGAAAPAAEGADNQTAAQMYMLAQLAEESAQTAASAAACLNGSELDSNQVAALAEASQQAAARATWAATSIASCFPEPLPGQPPEDEWTRSVRHVAAQAAEAAEQAAANCRVQATDLVAKLAASSKSKVPCKWFLLGQCRKTVCEFSHDIQDLQPRPLHKKRAEECVYFQKGQCTRGTACPFAHGPEELAEITRIVSDLKTDKRFVRR